MITSGRLSLDIVLPQSTIPKLKPCERNEMGSTDSAGPPIDDLICVQKPPANGNYHLNSVNGVVNPAWQLD